MWCLLVCISAVVFTRLGFGQAVHIEGFTTWNNYQKLKLNCSWVMYWFVPTDKQYNFDHITASIVDTYCAPECYLFHRCENHCKNSPS